MKRLGGVVAAVTSVGLALTGCGGDTAGSEGDAETADAAEAGCELEGETIELVVPYSAGGGYDVYARSVAPRLGEQLGAEVVVLNDPGAGGLLAVNKLFTAEPDGKTIAIFNMTGNIGAALGESEGIQFDPVEFSYIGQVSSEPNIVNVQAAGPYETFEDLAAAADSEPIDFSATGPGSSEYLDPLVLESALGLDNEIVAGFAGNSEASLAVTQGDVDANTGSLGSRIESVQAGDQRAVLIIGTESSEELPDVPTALEFAESDEQRELIEFHSRLVVSGRAFAAPPGVTEGCLTELRDAYEAAVTDEAFMAESAETGRPITFTGGEDVQQEVEQLMDAPTAYVDILKEGFAGA